MPLWMKDGALVIDADGNAVLCDDCPCIETVVTDCFVCCGAGELDEVPRYLEVSLTDTIGAGNPFPNPCTESQCSDDWQGTHLMEWESIIGTCVWGILYSSLDCLNSIEFSVSRNTGAQKMQFIVFVTRSGNPPTTILYLGPDCTVDDPCPMFSPMDFTLDSVTNSIDPNTTCAFGDDVPPSVTVSPV